jgi:hypothetical protein
MKHVALALLPAAAVTGALFLRSDRGLGVKRISFAVYKWAICDHLYARAAAAAVPGRLRVAERGHPEAVQRT